MLISAPCSFVPVHSRGVSHEEILRDFPYLEPDDIKAALAYAARQADHAVLQPV